MWVYGREGENTKRVPTLNAIEKTTSLKDYAYWMKLAYFTTDTLQRLQLCDLEGCKSFPLKGDVHGIEELASLPRAKFCGGASKQRGARVNSTIPDPSSHLQDLTGISRPQICKRLHCSGLLWVFTRSVARCGARTLPLPVSDRYPHACWKAGSVESETLARSIPAGTIFL
ncbi:hypothetical protein GOBAR_AA05578 [Gossypium barbadense]|uniref:Uncharacterized protein n=1 Tax=Gossypium barbadense TaxID=3634 RepID=A0A2P5YH99_GOSBA|nr:hypothetical protein GOBAR_AA05578 [Gossypium barbadense]